MIGMSAVHCQMANGIIVVITTEPYHTFMHGMGMDPACSLGFEALGMQTDRRAWNKICLLYTSPSPRDQRGSRMPSSA